MVFCKKQLTTNEMQELIENSTWKTKLISEFQKPYFKLLEEYVELERNSSTIYPRAKDTFNALNLTSFENTKVVIIGQDPYHSPNQAHGLSFSVNYGIKIPPSLANIYKELKSDINFNIPSHGNLTTWANQGVLLLNATLTVRAGEPGSHQKKGWETFTDAIIKLISNEKENCAFLLWGNFAKTKINLIDLEKHLVLTAAHPSPLAGGAFFGCKHFSKTNEYLISKKIIPINWAIPNADLFQ